MEPLEAKDARRYAEFQEWTPYEAALLLAGCKPLPRGHIPVPNGNTPAFNLIKAIQYCGPSKNLETPHPPETWKLWYSEYLAGRDFPEFSETAMHAWDGQIELAQEDAVNRPQGVKSLHSLLTTKDAVQQNLEGATPVRVAVESQIARQSRRYQMGIDVGLAMPTDDYAPMPRGIGKVAKMEKIARQSFTEDVKAHIRRAFPKK
jgi:hypothetical protein